MHPLAPSPPVVDDPGAPRLVLRDGTVATRAPLHARRSRGDAPVLPRAVARIAPEAVLHRRRTGRRAGRSAVRLGGRTAQRHARRRAPGRRRHAAHRRRLVLRDRRRAPPRWRSPSTIAFTAKGSRPSCSSGSPRSPADHGFRRFEATTLADNHAMLEVFRDSGFEVRSKSAAGVVEVHAHADAVGGRRRLGRDAPAARDGGLAAADARAAGRRGHRRVARSGEHRPAHSRRARSPPVSAARSIRSIRPPTRSPACARYRSVRDVPAGVDLAVVAVPRDARARASWTTAPRPA